MVLATIKDDSYRKERDELTKPVSSSPPPSYFPFSTLLKPTGSSNFVPYMNEGGFQFDTPKISTKAKTFGARERVVLNPHPKMSTAATDGAAPHGFPFNEFSQQTMHGAVLNPVLSTQARSIIADKPSLKKESKAPSEYEQKISQKVNRRVAFTCIPFMICILVCIGIFDLFTHIKLGHFPGLFSFLFGFAVNLRRLLICGSLILPLLAFKRIFYGSSYCSGDETIYGISLKHMLMTLAYVVSSACSTFIIFSPFVPAPLIVGREEAYIFSSQFFFIAYFSAAVAIYRSWAFFSRREHVLVYQCHPPKFKPVPARFSFPLYLVILVVFLIFKEPCAGLFLFVPRIFATIIVGSALSFFTGGLFLIAGLSLYCHVLLNVWSFDYFLILKEMTSNPRVAESMSRGILDVLPGLSSRHTHLRMLSLIDFINAFGKSRDQRSLLFEDVDSQPNSWAMIRDAAVSILRDWISSVASATAQLKTLETEVIENQDGSIWLNLGFVRYFSSVFISIYRSNLFISEYELVLLAIELSRLVIMFSYEEDKYGLVQGSLAEIFRLYLDVLFVTEEYQRIPFRHDKVLFWLGGFPGARREPSSCVLSECLITIHELHRIFADDLNSLELSSKYRSKLAAILAQEPASNAALD